jgi:2-polyprenyl-3-methyl-5-hydroxy-6-metoxy-1,4-benzoquinol methylase
MTAQYTIIEGIKCFHPSVANSYADYPDEGFDLTESNAEQSFWVRSRNRLFKYFVMSKLAPKSQTRLLEVGSGTGNFIKQLASEQELVITGSEIYLKGLIYAKRQMPEVEFIQFDVTDGVVDDNFDLIVAFDVLEHIEADEAAMSNMQRMLNDGGRVIISVPQHPFLWSRLDEIVKHKRRYTLKELTSKLEASGFAIEFTTSFVFMLFPLLVMQRALDRRKISEKSEKAELANRVTFSVAQNWILDRVMRIDEMLIRCGFSLPCGGTLVAIARKV